jgi:hypothetical protein
MTAMSGLPAYFYIALLFTFGLFNVIYSVPNTIEESNLDGISRFNFIKRKLSAQVLYNDSSLDDPVTRSSLLEIYYSTNGPAWTWVNASSVLGVWGTPGLSYCMWYGVQCCLTTPLSQLVLCEGDRSVSTLTLDSFGLKGSIPSQLGNLNQLAVLSLAQNPQLLGQLPPATSQLTKLLWLSVEVLPMCVLYCTVPYCVLHVKTFFAGKQEPIVNLKIFSIVNMRSVTLCPQI